MEQVAISDSDGAEDSSENSDEDGEESSDHAATHPPKVETAAEIEYKYLASNS